jgi:hypothetical protein
MGPTALLPLRRKCALGIFITRKNPPSSAGPEPATEYPVGSVASAAFFPTGLLSLLDTAGKVFEKILPTRVLRALKECRVLHDGQFGFRSRHSTTRPLACLRGRTHRNCEERRLTGAVYLDMAKAFDTAWVKRLLYKLTVLPGDNRIIIQFC